MISYCHKLQMDVCLCVSLLLVYPDETARPGPSEWRTFGMADRYPLKYGKTRWRPGLCPGPRWGSLRCFPRPPSRLGRGHPSPDSTPLSAFGASILSPSVLDSRRLQFSAFGAQFWRSHCC